MLIAAGPTKPTLPTASQALSDGLGGGRLLDFVVDTQFCALLAVIAVAGVARGMSGFGTGMIVAPVAAALYSPRWALIIIVLIDLLPMIPSPSHRL